MADEGASTSKATKRKMVSTSESDGVFSPPGKRYNLRTTGPNCVFSGNRLSQSQQSSSGSRCTVRGPATSYWGMAQTNRLNFQQAVLIPIYGPTRTLEPLLSFLFAPTTAHDKRELQGPDIVTTAIEQKIMEEVTDDPVEEFITETFEKLRKNGINLTGPGLLNIDDELLSKIETCLYKKKLEKKQSEKCNLPGLLLDHINLCLRDALWLTQLGKKTEALLDSLVTKMMEITQGLDDVSFFRIRRTDETEVKFDICGSLVTSVTNILCEAGNPGNVLTTHFPLVMSENKGCFTGGESESKVCVAKKKSEHMKLPQVIGQCISVADKSIFETKDHKIIYHVSLMSTNKIVITRTHVAKSTLKVIKDGCPIPDKNDLDPSYVFETAIFIANKWEFLIRHLFQTLKVFEKLGYLIVCEK